MILSSKKTRAILTLATLALALAACGRKPAHLDPPEGTVNDTFPKTYPAPAGKTDGGVFP